MIRKNAIVGLLAIWAMLLSAFAVSAYPIEE